jgi:hypothetical protein
MVTGEQYDALAANQIDAGFLRPPVQRSEFASKLVSKEALLAAIPARHPLTRKPRIDLADLHDQPFIMYDAHESRYFFDLVTALVVARESCLVTAEHRPGSAASHSGPPTAAAATGGSTAGSCVALDSAGSPCGR